MSMLRLLTAAALLAGARGAVAQESTLATLRIPVGAAIAGRGGAGVASRGEAGAFLVNPAAARDATGTLLHVARAAWLSDIAANHLSLSTDLAPGRFTAALTVVGYGSLERRGEIPTESPEGSFAPSDVFAALSYACPLPPRRAGLACGITLRGMTQRLDTDRASGVGFDLGLSAAPEGRPIAAGLALRHLGPVFGPGEDPLPLTAAAGLRLDAPAALRRRLDGSLFADLSLVRGSGSVVQIGADARLSPVLRLRAGRAFGIDAEGWSGGFDLRIERLGARVGYAFTDTGFGLDAAHRFDLAVGF